jgi:malate dehydrogenase (oxaloacetate-decarboxylating)(NADP+)
MDKDLYKSALDYHRYPTPGKLAIVPTKPLNNQRELSLAYSPGVAAACEEIATNPQTAAELTNRANLVAVVTNGTAVLGLGDIGPLAAKPVMEGKAVLFKKFAGIDVFDLCLKENNPDQLVNIIASLEPTFGGINLEDIKAPECFEIERKLRERLSIPVFHDDQHGTAIIVSAAVMNGLALTKKSIQNMRLVCSGAGAAAIACVQLLESLGLKKENVIMCDTAGVVYKGRPQKMDRFKEMYQTEQPCRTLEEALVGADIFLGLSVGNILPPDALKNMASHPLILALANPTPEVDPKEARRVRPDAIVATGRSDFPNQVNNVLCFPFIFRGALDVGATCINEAMKVACVQAIAALAKAEVSDVVANAYGSDEMCFGPDYIIPKPFDPRLIMHIAPAVAKAAMDSGVATRPLPDLEAYRQELSQHIYRSSLAMRPLFIQAKQDPMRLVYAEGEDERVLRAVQEVLDEGIAKPILVGRRRVVESRIEKLGLRTDLLKTIEIVDPEDDPRFNEYWRAYHKLVDRKGVSPAFAKTILHTNTTVIAAMMVHMGDADCMLCGAVGRYRHHLTTLVDIAGLKPSPLLPMAASMTVLTLDKGVFFFADGYVNADPTPEELASLTLQAAEKVKDFGMMPKVALLSHSNFGSSDLKSALKMRKTLELIRRWDATLEVDGEMHADAALDGAVREQVFPDSLLKGQANLLIMPDLESAHIGINLVKSLGDAQLIGPLLLGVDLPVHIMVQTTTVRGIVNMSAVAVTHAQQKDARQGTLIKSCMRVSHD